MTVAIGWKRRNPIRARSQTSLWWTEKGSTALNLLPIFVTKDVDTVPVAAPLDLEDCQHQQRNLLPQDYWDLVQVVDFVVVSELAGCSCRFCY
jgi:hypothetical protein